MPEHRKMAFDTVLLVAGLACAALLVAKGMTSGITLIGGLLLVPFFFSFVPVVSNSFGDGLYHWNKWKRGFVRYDSDDHPLLAKLLYCFWVCSSVIFAVFFFRIGA
jgi:hypothetical protein